MATESVHRCKRYPIAAEGGLGWEFVCPQCGYRARYIVGTQRLIILDPGDVEVRHTSESEAQTPPLTRPVETLDCQQEAIEEEIELPEWMVEQIEEILERAGYY